MVWRSWRSWRLIRNLVPLRCIVVISHKPNLLLRIHIIIKINTYEVLELLQVIAVLQFAPDIINRNMLLHAFLNGSLHRDNMEMAINSDGPRAHERAEEMALPIDCIQHILDLAVGLFVVTVHGSGAGGHLISWLAQWGLLKDSK